MDVLLRSLTCEPDKPNDALLRSLNKNSHCIREIKKFKTKHVWKLPPMFDPQIADAGGLAVGVMYERKEYGLVGDWHSKDVPALVVLQRRMRQLMPAAAADAGYPVATMV
jgi:hypothetical protein